MKPKNKLGVAFILMGAVLILSALSLLAYNLLEDTRAGKASENLMQQLKGFQNENSVIETVLPGEYDSELNAAHDSNEPEYEILPTECLEMQEVVIDGYSYIGYICIPELNLELPIMSDWDYERLKIAPCRQKGSTKTDDLVIMAHNYSRHFGNLNMLTNGSEVIITDVEGDVNSYVVFYSEKIDPENPDAILAADNDLVLYTCTYGGKLRLAVFCDRV